MNNTERQQPFHSAEVAHSLDFAPAISEYLSELSPEDPKEKRDFYSNLSADDFISTIKTLEGLIRTGGGCRRGV